MNYFECSVINGIGGSGSKVIVTCDAAFAGTTISCTKGTLVYTQTCPSTSPYQVTFEGLENGTWTISGTVGGQVWSSEVIVEDIEINLIYGLDWRKWLTEGRVTQTFSSLDEILADEETLRQLFLVHDAVDYICNTFNAGSMADVTKIFNTDLAAKWINLSDYALDHFYAVSGIKSIMDTADKYGYGEWVITDDTTTPPTWAPKGNVPVMTSATAPYGEVSASSFFQSGYEAYKVFDGNESTSWVGKTGNSTIQYKFINPICVKRVKVRNANGSNRPFTAIVKASNDGTTWTALTESFSVDTTNDYISVDINNNDYYLYLMLDTTATLGNGALITALQFYGRELKVSVPTMTSNTAPYGEVIGTFSLNNYPAWHAFDGNISTKTSVGDIASAIIGYHFINPIKVEEILWIANSDNPSLPPASIQLQGSNDGSTWVNIGEIISDIVADHNAYVRTFDSNVCYNYLQCVCVPRAYSDGHYYAQFSLLQFYGKDYSEKEFEVGTTKKWLYDHGVELETLTITGTGTKNDDYIQLTAANAQASATIDTTDYSLMRGKVGAHASGTNQLLCGSGSSNFTASNMPNNNGLDVSSINGSNAVGVKQTAIGVFDATEIWLE